MRTVEVEPKVLEGLLAERFFSSDVGRALFLTVLQRLMVCGSDRFCDKLRRTTSTKGLMRSSFIFSTALWPFSEKRIEDVIYFNLADFGYLIAANPLERTRSIRAILFALASVLASQKT